MTVHEALELVEKDLEHAIENFRKSRNYYRRASLAQTLAASVLSAATTLLIALNEVYKNSALVTASLVTAATATVAAGWTIWLGARRLWISNNRALVNLYALRERIAYEKAAHDGVVRTEVIDRYFAELQDIVATANKTWEDVRTVESAERR